MAIMSEKKKILLVDDDGLAAAAVEHVLLKAGYDVVTLDGGLAALRWLETNAVDLILLDVVMPGLSGFDVCRRLREDPAHRLTPIVFLTAKDRVKDMTEGMSRLLKSLQMFLSTDLPLARKRTALPTI
jgi:two-component system alkaline phosphatase synthesis response regulator PhoP